MKRNLALLLVLILLLCVAYYTEEFMHQKNETISAQQSALYNPEELGGLEEIIGENFHLIRYENSWYVKDPFYPADPKLVDEFLQILGGVKKRDRTFSNNDMYFQTSKINLTFIFSNSRLDFTLGDKVTFDESFYMKVKVGNVENVVLADDKSPLPHVYTASDGESLDLKYKRLQKIFAISSPAFFNRSVLKSFPLRAVDIDEISFNDDKKLRFTLDFKNQKITAVSLPQLESNPRAFLSFLEKFYALKSRELILNGDKKLLRDFMGSIVVRSQNQRFQFSLYSGYGKRAGYYISLDFDKTIYEVDLEQTRPFFERADFFLVRNLSSLVNHDYTLTFSHDGAQWSLESKGGELLAPPPSIYVIDLAQIKKLVSFLERDADFITSDWSKISKMNPLFQFGLDKERISLYLSKDHYVLALQERKLLYLYERKGLPPFSLNGVDYYTKKVKL